MAKDSALATAPSIEAKVQIVREHERFRITGLSRVQWWRLEREGKVPRRIQLGVNSVGWLRHELEAWVADRAAQREPVAQ
jgi:prophage regulatory protein